MIYERNREKDNETARKRYHDPAWRAIHLPIRAERARKLREKQALAKLKKCPVCGVEFRSQVQRKLCSEKCAVAYVAIRTRNHRSKPEVKEKIARRYRDEYHRRPEVKIRRVVNACITAALKRTGGKKTCSVLEALPYSIPQLKAHLESMFDNENGFSWENHGTVWHIDHLIPQVCFPYTVLDSKNFRDCWALTNLRPLRVVENLKKGSKYPS